MNNLLTPDIVYALLVLAGTVAAGFFFVVRWVLARFKSNEARAEKLHRENAEQCREDLKHVVTRLQDKEDLHERKGAETLTRLLDVLAANAVALNANAEGNKQLAKAVERITERWERNP